MLENPIQRKFGINRVVLPVNSLIILLFVSLSSQASSLRYFGNGVNDIDRVKIEIDNPNDNNPGPPADIGDTDFTIEFWVMATSDNQQGLVNCGANNNWTTANQIIDRDRFGQGREIGIALGLGRLVFGTSNSSSAQTICGTTDIIDGQWHHVAAQRRRSDGRMWLWVDGNLEAEQDGPDGDISYPDDGTPLSLCGPSATASCNFSDPYLVIGAEKHDAPTGHSFSGWVDELRLSTVLRYNSSFTPPGQAFVADGNTAALYHFDEGSGDFIGDSSFGALSPGERRFGGSPAGPQWDSATPFSAGGSPGALQFSSSAYSVAENTSSVTITARRVGGSSGAVSVSYASSDGSATAGADYQAVSGTLNWADGDASDKTFAVSITDDADVEGDETVNLALSNATGGASLGTPISATLSITDNDSAVNPPVVNPPPVSSSGGGRVGLPWVTILLVLAGYSLRRRRVTKCCADGRIYDDRRLSLKQDTLFT